ncbi:MAG: hypothetical protein AAF216_09430, partial [Pseudomonadota bacterium]
NGAQAHISVGHGETLDVMMCSLHGERTVTMELPGEPPKDTPETCCGDSTVPAALPADPPVRLLVPMGAAWSTALPRAPVIHPGSPLWPGAPPQGPPLARIA